MTIIIVNNDDRRKDDESGDFRRGIYEDEFPYFLEKHLEELQDDNDAWESE